MTPAGYTYLRRDGVRALVRHDLVVPLGGWLLADEIVPLPAAEAIESGRGGAFRASVGGLRLVVRPCRRGGWIARILGETYLGLRPRPWRELAVSVAARARAVPAPAVVAVRVAGWGAYRGVVVTEEAAGAVTLAAALRAAASDEERGRLARAAGEAVARLHAAGVEHADLNLFNILVRPEPAGAAALVIDLDKARLRRAPLARRRRRRNLRRLERSWRRVSGADEVPPELRRGFGGGYAAVDGFTCAC
ncbi:MAG TPA: lipopolysaccharide kinase InaA family protein [Vicinamibacterales bacterium]|nr:lipopolysaccharide kinase InaA family protein [Vicinamibacterales bacterium]